MAGTRGDAVEGRAAPGQPRPGRAERGERRAVGRGPRRQHQEGLQHLAVHAPEPVAEPGLRGRRRGQQREQRRQLGRQASALRRAAAPGA